MNFKRTMGSRLKLGALNMRVIYAHGAVIRILTMIGLDFLTYCFCSLWEPERWRSSNRSNLAVLSVFFFEDFLNGFPSLVLLFIFRSPCTIFAEFFAYQMQTGNHCALNFMAANITNYWPFLYCSLWNFMFTLCVPHSPCKIFWV